MTFQKWAFVIVLVLIPTLGYAQNKKTAAMCFKDGVHAHLVSEAFSHFNPLDAWMKKDFIDLCDEDRERQNGGMVVQKTCRGFIYQEWCAPTQGGECFCRQSLTWRGRQCMRFYRPTFLRVIKQLNRVPRLRGKLVGPIRAAIRHGADRYRDTGVSLLMYLDLRETVLKRIHQTLRASFRYWRKGAMCKSLPNAFFVTTRRVVNNETRRLDQLEAFIDLYRNMYSR